MSDPFLPPTSAELDRLETGGAAAAARLGLGLAGGPVVELMDTGTPGRVVAYMPSGPYQADTEFVSYLDPEGSSSVAGPGPIEILIVPAFLADQ